MPEKARRIYPRISMVVNPYDADLQAYDPSKMRGGEDFRLIEDQGDRVVPLDPTGVEILDWRISIPQGVRKGDGTSIGDARIRIPEYRGRTVDFAVDVITGALTTKPEYAMREKLTSTIGDPTLSLRDTVRHTISGLSGMTHVSDVGIALITEDPITLDGGTIQYYHMRGGKLFRPTRELSGESEIVKSILTGSEAVNVKPVEQDLVVVGDDVRKMAVVPLNILPADGDKNIIGCVMLLNRSTRNIGESDLENVGVVAGPIAVEIHKKSRLAEDPISGAMDRRSFEARSREHLTSNLESPESVILAVSDLDGFKDHVVSPFGHVAASSVIRQFVRLSKKVLGEDGIMGAYGGDEFTFIMWDGAVNSLSRLSGIKDAVESHRFTVALPADKKDLIVRGDDVSLLRVRDGHNRIMVTEDTTVQESGSNIILGLPPGTVTVTVGAASMLESEDLGVDPMRIYHELIGIGLDRLNGSKHSGKRNRVVYGGP
ncbi:MAG: diguanylate cyclase [Candidatus Altiarchaeales archaeon]|nr:diguanylate cyclase [Candidatus Altiarchaeales archaeon]MBD3416805.1 diguanylate cyclase [Candidatus Altiarchaeales archaeon]